MALHLNLYHEVQTQQHQSQRDPFKLGVLGLLLIAVCFAAYYLFRLETVRRLKAQHSSLQTQWDAIRPKQEAAAKRTLELTTTINSKTALVQRIENRFYWAPVLEQLLQMVPPEVQIKRFIGSVATEKAKTNSLSLEGIAAGSNPRNIAEELRTSLNKSKKYKAEFKSLEEGNEVLTTAGKTWPAADFTIDVEVINAGSPKTAPVESKPQVPPKKKK